MKREFAHRYFNERTDQDVQAVKALKNVKNPNACFAAANHDNTKQAFLERYGVDSLSTGARCLRRLKGGKCKRGYPGGCDIHSIPHKDHVQLWLDDGRPAVYSTHLYDLPYEYVKDIVSFCEENGFRAHFDSGLSYYYPSLTTLVAVESKERNR